MPGTEVGKGYVGITADAKGLQTQLTSMGSTLGGKMGPLGALLGGKLGKGMGGGIEGELGGSKSGIMGLASMLGAAGPWGVAAGAAVAGAAAIGVGLYKLGGSFEEAYRSIARSTGASGKDLTNLETAFKNVAKTTPASFGEIATTISEVQRVTGTSGKTLETLSTQFLTLSRITGTDVKTNVESGTKALEQWNIKGPAANTALNQMYTATQKSGIGFGQLSGEVTKFAPQLRTMGYSFADSTAMLASFDQHGVNTGKVMGAMQIAGAKFAKQGVKDIPAAMQATMDSIKGASNETDALNIATTAFGSRGAVQMVQAIRGGKLDFAEMSKEVKNSGDSIHDTAQRTQTLGGAFGKLKNQTKVALEPLSTEVFKGINAGLIGMAQGLTVALNYLPAVMSRIGAVFGTLAPTIKASFAVIGPLFKVLGDAITLVADLLTGKWGKAWQDFGALFRAAMDVLKGFPRMMFELITQPIREVLALFGDTGKKIGDAIANIPTVVANVFAAIPGAVTGALGGFWSVVSAIPGQVIGFLAGLGGAVFGAIAGGFSTAAGAAGAALGSFFSTVGALPGRVVSTLAGLGGAVFSAIFSGFSTAAGAAAGALGGLWSVLAGIPGRAVSAIGNVGSLLAGVGRDMIQGLINGIGSLAGAVEDKIKSVVTAPINVAKSLLHIGSPSGVFRDIGKNTMLGYIEGVSAMGPAATRALNLALPDTPTMTGGTTAAGARGGAAVVIQEAHFHDELDVESFMRRAAWVAETSGV